MIESLITSKTRIKLLLKFFLNSQTKSYLRSLETEFGESTNRMENAGLLESAIEGNKKMFSANSKHPLFLDINNILKKFIGIDQITKLITSQIGNLHSAYLIGDFAIGKDSEIIDITLIGEHLDRLFIETLVEKAESYIKRRIKYIVLTQEEMIQFFNNKPVLQIWNREFDC
jgi:hypothetical protein